MTAALLFRQVRTVLAVRHGPCVLGDDFVRGSDRRSFVTVTTLQPCVVLSVPSPVYKSVMEGLTLQLLGQLRVQHKATDIVARCARSPGQVDARKAR